MMCVELELVGNLFFQSELNRHDILSGRKIGTVADAEDMRVDRDRLLAESNVKHDVGGLAAGPRSCLEFFTRARHLAAMAFDQQL